MAYISKTGQQLKKIQSKQQEKPKFTGPFISNLPDDNSAKIYSKIENITNSDIGPVKIEPIKPSIKPNTNYDPKFENDRIYGASDVKNNNIFASKSIDDVKGHLGNITKNVGSFIGTGLLSMAETAGAETATKLATGMNDEEYQRMRKRYLTGSENGELTGSQKVSDVLGKVAGTVYNYKGAGKLISKIPTIGAIKNPIVKNIVSGQIGDTIVQTPRVIIDGARNNKGAGEIALDVAKQQGTDLLFNLGIEGAGQAYKGIKKLKDTKKLDKIADDMNRTKEQGIINNIKNKDVLNSDVTADGVKFKSDIPTPKPLKSTNDFYVSPMGNVTKNSPLDMPMLPSPKNVVKGISETKKINFNDNFNSDDFNNLKTFLNLASETKLKPTQLVDELYRGLTKASPNQIAELKSLNKIQKLYGLDNVISIKPTNSGYEFNVVNKNKTLSLENLDILNREDKAILKTIQNIADENKLTFSETVQKFQDSKNIDFPLSNRKASAISKIDNLSSQELKRFDEIERVNMTDDGIDIVYKNKDIPYNDDYFGKKFEIDDPKYINKPQEVKEAVSQVFEDYPGQSLGFANIADINKKLGLDNHNYFNAQAQLDAMNEVVLAKAKPILEKFIDNFVDKQAVFDVFDKLDKSSSTMDRISIFRKSPSTAKYILNHNLVDMQGNELGKGLDSIFGQVKESDRTIFNEYLAMVHNIDRWKVKKPLFTNVSVEDSKYIVNDILKSKPEFKKIADELYQFDNNFTQKWLVDSGLISQGQYNIMKAMYPHYVPGIRDFGADPFQTTIKNFNRKSLTPGKIIQSADVGNDPIFDIKTQYENRIFKTVSAANRNSIYNNILDKVSKQPEKFKEYARLYDNADEYIAGNVRSIELNRNVDDVLDEIAENGLVKKGDVLTLSAVRNGKPVKIAVNERVFKALDNSKNNTEKFIDNASKISTQPFKNVVTQYNPLFAVRNVARDMPTAMMNTQGTVLDFTKKLPSTIASMKNNDELFRKFIAMGGGESTLISATGGFKKKIPVLTQIAKLNNFTEMVPRYNEFRTVFLKSDGSYESLLKALNASADITVDFSKGGNITKLVDKAILPYTNARLQGFVNFIDHIKTKKGLAKVARRGGLIFTIPTAFFYFLNKDNPFYNNLSERQKTTYINIPNYAGRMLDGKPTEFIKIPKSNQYAFLLGTLIDKTMRAKQGDRNAFSNIWLEMENDFMPVSYNAFKNNFYRPLMNFIDINSGDTNITDFADRKIISSNLAKLPKELQFDESTSEISKYLGNGFNVSPQAMQYLLKSYGGVIGDVILPATTPANYASGTALSGITKGFTADGLYNTDIVNDYYDLKENIDITKNGFQKLQNVQEYAKYKYIQTKFNEDSKILKNFQTVMDTLPKNSEGLRRVRSNYLNKLKEINNKYEKFRK